MSGITTSHARRRDSKRITSILVSTLTLLTIASMIISCRPEAEIESRQSNPLTVDRRLQDSDVVPPEPYRGLFANPWPQPILTAAEVVSLSIKFFPNEKNPHDIVTRLVTMDQVYQWTSGSASLSSPQDLSPMWVVAILGDGITDYDLQIPFEGILEVEATPAPSSAAGAIPTSDPLAGMLFIWDANSGDIITIYPLVTSNSAHGVEEITYASVLTLPNMPLVISAATEGVLPDITNTPDPDETETPAPNPAH